MTWLTWGNAWCMAVTISLLVAAYDGISEGVDIRYIVACLLAAMYAPREMKQKATKTKTRLD